VLNAGCYVGISLRGIKEFILVNYPQVDPNTLKVRVAKALDNCMNGSLIHKPETSSEKPAALVKQGL